MARISIKHMQFFDGQWHCRMAIPPRLKAFFDKSHLRESLGPDRAKAERKLPAVKARFIEMLDEAEARLKGEKVVNEPEFLNVSTEDLGSLHYAATIKRGERHLNANHTHPDDIYDREIYAELVDIAASQLSNEQIRDSELTSVASTIERFKAQGYLRAEFDTPEWRDVARRLAGAEAEAMNITVAKAAGDIWARPRDEQLTKQVVIPVKTDRQSVEIKSKVRIWMLFDDYFTELKAAGKGEEAARRWRSVFNNLEKHLGHDDASRITNEDIIGWKDTLLKTLSTKTISDVYLAAVRSVFTWAVTNRRIDTSPADGVRVKKAARKKNRDPGYSDAEALAIVQKCVSYEPIERSNPSNRESSFAVACKRWVPLLEAFSGARVTEICQLRKQDILVEGDVHYMRLTPEAGSIKTGEYRDVPLHPQVIELGFLEYVKSCDDGPIFYDQRDGKASPLRSARMAGERVGRWLHANGLVPDGIRPNHAWRHRLKTQSRVLGLNVEMVKFIVGHSIEGDVSMSYGGDPLTTKAKELAKLPPYKLNVS